jgi:hypothetical protein
VHGLREWMSWPRDGGQAGGAPSGVRASDPVQTQGGSDEEWSGRAGGGGMMMDGASTGRDKSEWARARCGRAGRLDQRDPHQ